MDPTIMACQMKKAYEVCIKKVGNEILHPMGIGDAILGHHTLIHPPQSKK